MYLCFFIKLVEQLIFVGSLFRFRNRYCYYDAEHSQTRKYVDEIVASVLSSTDLFKQMVYN